MSQNITLQPGESVTVTAAAAATTPPPGTGTPPPDTGTPTPPPAGPGCGEFTPMNLEMAWPGMQNVTLDCPSGWTRNVAAVVHFKAGTKEGDTATFQPAHRGPPYQNMVMSVSDAPGCNVCTVHPPVPPILKAAVSQTPVFHFKVGGVSDYTYIALKPGGDYWITMTWQNGFGGANSCVSGDCGAGIRFDFMTT